MSTPSKVEKLILDATAGYRMMWFNKQEPHTTYLDSRPECEPDILGNYKDLSQFPNNKFKLIIFDPPFFPKKDNTVSCAMDRRFGYLTPETWRSDLKQAFKELWRVLAPTGTLIIKWQTTYYSSADILQTFTEKPLIYQIARSKQREWGGDGGKAKAKRNGQGTGKPDLVYTLYFVFMKFPEEKQTA